MTIGIESVNPKIDSRAERAPQRLTRLSRDVVASTALIETTPSLPAMAVDRGFGSYDMVRLSFFLSLAKSRLLFRLLCFLLAALDCVPLGATTLAKNDLLAGCRVADPNVQIVKCTQLIERESRGSKFHRMTAYLNRGMAYRTKGDLDQALADLGKALRLDPKSERALLGRASIYLATGKLDHAIADYDAAISAYSKSPAAFFGRGEAYRAKNDFDRAIADYDKALELDKNFVAVHGSRARAYRDKGDISKALANFDDAVRLEPKTALTHIERGSLYQVAGDLDRAIADYDQAIEIDPNAASVFVMLAAAYRAKHDLEHARQNLKAALRLDPQLIAAKDALDEVNKIVAKSAAPVSAMVPTAPPAPAASPLLIVLVALVALIGLFAIIIINFRSKPTDKSHRSKADQPVAPLDGYLAEVSRLKPGEACARAGSSLEGLSQTESDMRLKTFGLNLVAREAKATVLQELWGRARNPLNALLLSLATASYFLGDVRAAVVIAAMVVLAITTAFIQEHQSNEAAARLRAMVHTTASVRRTPCDADAPFWEIPIEQLVPGDVVRLSAGDIIPADLRLLKAKDLFINQSALTGEAMPAEKFAHASDSDCRDPFELPNVCFMGANVVSGYGAGVILRTGSKTFFGRLADQIAGRRIPTAFDQGVNRFTWLMIRFILVMVPTVFVINGLTKHDWLEALLFAVAVAVGLTPEMLPMIVTVNLAKGAIAMSRKKVIVKRLNAIQNFGAMDVLCTDKTGTLTQDRIILKRHLDIYGEDSDRVLEYAYLNSHFQSGLKNLLDIAVLQHAELEAALRPSHRFTKIDEIPFDFNRRRLSVVVQRDDGQHLLICKGAVEELFSISTRYETGSECAGLDPSHLETAKRETAELNADGFRVVAVAYKEMPPLQTVYSVADEADLTLLGYIAFLDPPKESAAEAIANLAEAGVSVKILTGDNEIVTRKICKDVGLKIDRVVLGSEIEHVSDDALSDLAATTIVFAKLSPPQKAKVIEALHRKGRVVGYLGDGINDGPALKVADVGISVDTAVDIAKESADIILLEKSLLVLTDGAIEGRRIFANITKYIKMGASSNFGNMFSVLGASIFLPFLPMAPIQVLTNNLLYDFSQTTIPTDNVDDEYLTSPRKWDISNIFKFMIFIGPISSIFDYATYGMMLYIFNAWDNPSLFQTGWFVESLLTQTLIIHIIRTARIPFLESRASNALIATTVIICAVGIALPFTWAGSMLGFRPLPRLYWPLVIAMLATYALLTHLMKVWFIRRWGL
jgi:Mg2+-importing ATPase